MPWFKCLVQGENFPGALIRKKVLVGFYATRWVEAPSAAEAEFIALDLLRADPMLQLKTEPKSKEARIYFEEIVEVSGPGGVNSGATWYEMD